MKRNNYLDEENEEKSTHMPKPNIRYYEKVYSNGEKVYCANMTRHHDLTTWELRSLDEIAEVIKEYRGYYNLTVITGANPKKPLKGENSKGQFELRNLNEEDEARLWDVLNKEHK